MCLELYIDLSRFFHILEAEESFIVKPADKVRAIVIWPVDNIHEASKQLALI